MEMHLKLNRLLILNNYRLLVKLELTEEISSCIGALIYLTKSKQKTLPNVTISQRTMPKDHLSKSKLDNEQRLTKCKNIYKLTCLFCPLFCLTIRLVPSDSRFREVRGDWIRE